MIMQETKLPGAYLITPDKISDNRGFFGRLLCAKELRDKGLNATILQSNIGVSHKKGTLRGLHFQMEPHREVKIIRCTKGAVYDVIVDLRPESKTYKNWYGVELTADNYAMLYVPEGFAQGYLTLTDDAEIYYNTSQYYAPKVATGVRYNDPAFNIKWPIGLNVISDQDKSWPDYQ